MQDFLDLQELREEADYDLMARPRKTDADLALEKARRSTQFLLDQRTGAHGKAFLALALGQARLLSLCLYTRTHGLPLSSPRRFRPSCANEGPAFGCGVVELPVAKELGGPHRRTDTSGEVQGVSTGAMKPHGLAPYSLRTSGRCRQ
jgi:hypothetical protein